MHGGDDEPCDGNQQLMRLRVYGEKPLSLLEARRENLSGRMNVIKDGGKDK
jgi:hypothetical protein